MESIVEVCERVTDMMSTIDGVVAARKQLDLQLKEQKRFFFEQLPEHLIKVWRENDKVKGHYYLIKTTWVNVPSTQYCQVF